MILPIRAFRLYYSQLFLVWVLYIYLFGQFSYCAVNCHFTHSIANKLLCFQLEHFRMD